MIEIECNQCRSSMSDGQDCYCAKCFKSLEDNIKDLEADISNLESEKDELEQQIEALNKKLENIESEIRRKGE